MRPYFYDAKRHGYVVSGSMVQRPTRNAAGMSYTGNRGDGRHLKTMDHDRLALTVRGTLDTLRNGLLFSIQHKVCPCCNAKTGKWMLNDRGRQRLAMRRRCES
jgi:hypothetical protein